MITEEYLKRKRFKIIYKEFRFHCHFRNLKISIDCSNGYELYVSFNDGTPVRYDNMTEKDVNMLMIEECFNDLSIEKKYLLLEKIIVNNQIL